MKKWWILMLMGISALAQGKELNTFNEISDALMHGDSIRMVVQDSEKSGCSFFTEVNAVKLQPAYLQFANTHLTTNYPGFEKSPLLENVTYRISADGKVCITIRVFVLPGYHLKKEHSMTCILGDSAKVYTK